MVVPEAWLVRKELSDAKVPVIVYPGQIEPWGFEALAARDDLAAMLEASGVPVISPPVAGIKTLAVSVRKRVQPYPTVSVEKVPSPR